MQVTPIEIGDDDPGGHMIPDGNIAEIVIHRDDSDDRIADGRKVKHGSLPRLESSPVALWSHTPATPGTRAGREGR